jgi:glycosyltransferase involved in cell wall biosynthesis
MTTQANGNLQNSGDSLPFVSVILPILNEENYLEGAVSSILSQDYLGKFEVILAVGPSHDRTREIADNLQARNAQVFVVDNPTGRTATGLNLALASSKGSIIVRVDGHAELPRSYIANAVETLQKTGAANVGGIMAAEGVTRFEKAVAKAMRSPLGVGASRFHTGGTPGPVDTVYLGVFSRKALLEVGGFDERFTRAQDWELNFRLRSNGGIIYFDPRLQVTYRPRPTIFALAKQYFQYGTWRRVVSRRHKGTINLRYLAPPVALLGFVSSLLLGIFLHPFLLVGAAIYLLAIAISALILASTFQEYLYLLLIIPTMHFSWGAGFITSQKNLVPLNQ